MTAYHQPLEENTFYHIYNRGNNGENLFYKEENYWYFLRKYDEYLSDYLETYAYCLLPNHFHLLIRVKDSKDYEGRFLKTGTSNLVDTDKIISELFRRFFTSYSKSVNKQESRKGSLFQKNFKRKAVLSDSYFTRLVWYIHSNPKKHQIFNSYKEYPYSSYGRIILDRPTKLLKKEVLD